MQISKRHRLLAGILGVAALLLPGQAHAWWRGGFAVVVPAPIVVPPPPVYVAPPPPVFYPPPAYYYGPPRPLRWVPGHWRGPYWIPGHWA